MQSFTSKAEAFCHLSVDRIRWGSGEPHLPGCLLSSQCPRTCCSWQYFFPSFAPLGWLLLLSPLSTSTPRPIVFLLLAQFSASPVRGRSWHPRPQGSISREVLEERLDFWLGLLVATVGHFCFVVSVSVSVCCDSQRLSERRSFHFRSLQTSKPWKQFFWERSAAGEVWLEGFGGCSKLFLVG